MSATATIEECLRSIPPASEVREMINETRLRQKTLRDLLRLAVRREAAGVVKPARSAVEVNRA